jgi:hypothetical protein
MRVNDEPGKESEGGIPESFSPKAFDSPESPDLTKTETQAGRVSIRGQDQQDTTPARQPKGRGETRVQSGGDYGKSCELSNALRVDLEGQPGDLETLPVILTAMGVQDGFPRPLTRVDCEFGSPPLNQEERNHAREREEARYRERQEKAAIERQREIIGMLKSDAEQILSSQWAGQGLSPDWLYADYANQRVAMAEEEQRLIRELTEDGEDRVYTEFWRWKMTQLLQLWMDSRMNVHLYYAAMKKERVVRYLEGGSRENAKVLGIVEGWRKYVDAMFIWNQEFGTLLSTLTNWSNVTLDDNMIKEWGSQDGPDFINICKLFIIKRVTMGADDEGSVINKVIRGILMPTICMRAIDIIIRAEEAEIIPRTWLVGQHFQCDRDITTHTQTVFNLLKKYADAWGVGPHSKFSCQLGMNMRLISVRNIHLINKGWGVSESEVGLFQNWTIMQIQAHSGSINVNPQDYHASSADASTVVQIEHILGICNSQLDIKLSRAKDIIDLGFQASIKQKAAEQRDFVDSLSDRVRALTFQASVHNLETTKDLIEERFREQNEQVHRVAGQVEQLRQITDVIATEGLHDEAQAQDLRADVNSLRELMSGQATESARAKAVIDQQGQIIQQLRNQSGQAEMIEITKRSLQQDLPDMVKDLISQVAVAPTRMEELEVKMSTLLKENRELRAGDDHRREESGARVKKQDSTLEEMRKRLQEIQLSQAQAPKIEDMFAQIRQEQKAATASVMAQVATSMATQ